MNSAWDSNQLCWKD